MFKRFYLNDFCKLLVWLSISPANIYLFKVQRNTRKECDRVTVMKFRTIPET